ncbi:MAG: sensor histidine kinase [Chitinophagaceae bacterium]|nr:sensor histidine kinase [Chitinophagaceae bacterium]
MQKVTDNIFLLVLFAMIGTFILAASFIFFFLRYQRKIATQKAALQKAEIEYGEQLLNATLLSQEDERKRIGRDLHDDVGASLSNLKMIMAQTIETDESKNKYKPLIDNIITTVRTISHTLSPPGLELFGLDYAMHELADSFNISGKIEVSFANNTGTKADKLSKQTALAIYRIVQELLSNTIKHANAKKIAINFDAANDGIVVGYKDDGKGMDLDANNNKFGMGMKNIEARIKMMNASYNIISSLGDGFGITITVKQ